jgi:hypothetical protein
MSFESRLTSTAFRRNQNTRNHGFHGYERILSVSSVKSVVLFDSEFGNARVD